eukprot:NODE_1502_length_2456_cov_9.292400.p1 GENE.NODE_1502_length_2456_cov_9.292400~~NODE_1502_length_2456_cov_9.292400.p1  ORF type:complete len:720 (+),score=194.91 NODE_1502_length_2456_cov_9.292400:75-2234(+)
MSAIEEETPTHATVVVLRVLHAHLTRNFEVTKLSRMDPAAVVYWSAAGAQKEEISRTRTDWNAHFDPKWDHFCCAQLYSGPGGGDRVTFEVVEVDAVPVQSTVSCGSVEVAVEELLSGTEVCHGHAKGSAHAEPGRLVTLPLRANCGETGHIAVQAVLIQQAHYDRLVGPSGESFTRVAETAFEAPVERIGVSGGTAPFFTLKLVEDGSGRSPEHYIGKDLAHAVDEITFYEELLQNRAIGDASGLAAVMPFFFEYLGVLTVAEQGRPEDEPKKDLLVMRNLFDGVESLRLLDFKIGFRTGQAGWHGKSRTHAIRQSIVDFITNSSQEGFRLEGFDGRPPTIRSQDPLLDIKRTSSALRKSDKINRKALRLMFQRMKAAEVLEHFFDLHQEPGEPHEAAAIAEVLSPAEFAEIVNHEVLRRMAELERACRRVQVPQKWIGSSIALGFDCGRLPPRSMPEADIRAAVRVNVFDWGRSELNTVSKHAKLSVNDQRDRQEFWKDYICGVDRLFWEVARRYRHCYTNTKDWKEVVFRVYDFDSLTGIDFMAKVTVPVVETTEKTVKMANALQRRMVAPCRGRGNTQLTYSMAWQAFPRGSRLVGAWRVTVLRISGLYHADMKKGTLSSDPLCTLTATSKDHPVHTLRVETCVKLGTLNPEYDETFSLPVAANSDELEAALYGPHAEMGSDHLGRMLPAGKGVYVLSHREWADKLKRDGKPSAA